MNKFISSLLNNYAYFKYWDEQKSSSLYLFCECWVALLVASLRRDIMSLVQIPEQSQFFTKNTWAQLIIFFHTKCKKKYKL